MWTIEAYAALGDHLVWEVDLAGVDQSMLEAHLGIDTLDAPGSLPLRGDQVRSILAGIMCLRPDDFFGHNGLEFFLAEYGEAP